MAVLADAPDLGSGGNPRAGSTPVIRRLTELYCMLHKVRFFYIIGNFSEISYYVKSSPRDAQLAAEKFALRHRSRAKCVQAHTFL